MKNSNLKVYIVTILLLFANGIVWSQEDLVDFAEISRPAMAVYENVPVDYCTGVPDISYGLPSLPTASKDFSFNLSLNYHPGNKAVQQKVGEVGRGWTVFGIPSISKDVVGTESDENTLFSSIIDGTETHHVDDTYYFNINGENGKFRFVYNTTNGGVSILSMTPTQFKITFTYTADTSLKIHSFTITDTNGLSYYFDKYDFKDNTRSTFFLTRVNDSNNLQLCSLSYQEVYVKYNTQGTVKITSINKLDEVIATGVGKLKFNYTTNMGYLDKNYEVSTLNSISLLTVDNVLIKKSTFNYSQNTRVLVGLAFAGGNLATVENYKFEYSPTMYPNDPDDYVTGSGLYESLYHRGFDRYGYRKVIKKCSVKERIITSNYANKKSVIGGVLNKVVLPTGGMIEYEFESNTVDPEGYVSLPHLKTFNFNDDFSETEFPGHNFETFTLKPLVPALEEDYVNNNTDNFYIENLGTSSYNVEPNDLPIFFQLTQDTELYINFTGQGNPSPYIEDPAAQNLTIGYQILNSASNVVGSDAVSIQDANNCLNLSDKITLAAGWYRIKIIAPFGGYVSYTMFAKRKEAVRKSYYYAAGVRIKSIKHYENENSTSPIKNLSFEYMDFNDSTRSSGEIYNTAYNTIVYNGTTAHVLYKNVKVSEGNNGYTKYSYYTPMDFAYNLVNNFVWLYYKSLSKGLVHRKQIFNATGSLLESEKNYYVLEPTGELVDNMYHYLVAPTLVGNQPIYNHYIQRQYTKTEKYLSGTVPTVLKSVVVNNNWNFKPESITQFDSQNRKLKTRYYYLNEIPSTPYASNLISKNILSSPLVVEQYYDGTLMSKAKSEFEDFGNGLFKKARSYTAKGNGAYTLEQRVSQVDNLTNKIKEVTNDKGSFTSYIWGYNMTQPVAKIENMAYSSIPAGLITTIQNATNIANNEANILATLSALRNDNALANAMVTTYTYKPLVGISSVTDPKGDKVTYHYDTFNRLIAVRDKDNNLLTENQYHFRPQN